MYGMLTEFLGQNSIISHFLACTFEFCESTGKMLQIDEPKITFEEVLKDIIRVTWFFFFPLTTKYF